MVVDDTIVDARAIQARGGPGGDVHCGVSAVGGIHCVITVLLAVAYLLACTSARTVATSLRIMLIPSPTV